MAPAVAPCSSSCCSSSRLSSAVYHGFSALSVDLHRRGSRFPELYAPAAYPSLRSTPHSNIAAATRYPDVTAEVVLQDTPAAAAAAAASSASDNDDGDNNWETELVDDLSPLIPLRLGMMRTRRRRRHSKVPAAEAILPSDASTPAEWAERARQRALVALECRNPAAASLLKEKTDPASRKKNKKRTKKKVGNRNNTVDEDQKTRGSERMARGRKHDGNGLGDIGSSMEERESDELQSSWRPVADSSSDREGRKGEVTEREKMFNRRLIEANGANEVLEIVGRAVETKGFPSVLTPFNTATALHRIAKHMEASSMPELERLAFARKRSMAELVAVTMELLSSCSAQGLSNIAWALSKVGGCILYRSEMDLIAQAALRMTSDLNSQNVANMLSAYASMHHAAPDLFTKLCHHASEIVDTFSSLELAQVLWSHAELSQPADPLLNAIDCIFIVVEKGHNTHDGSPSTLRNSPVISDINPFGNASAEHLANIAWSYAVLDQVSRLSFRRFWRMLDDNMAGYVDEDQNVLSTWHLCQIQQVNLCLQYEYSPLGLALKTPLGDIAAGAWEKQKSNSVTSSYQKNVKWLLVSMGQDWVAEYKFADYSLDFAMVEKKIALEFDGPSHFIRNTGLPLGHTLLKRRLLASSGWRVLSIPHEEWEELDGELEQMQYLKKLLRFIQTDYNQEVCPLSK